MKRIIVILVLGLLVYGTTASAQSEGYLQINGLWGSSNASVSGNGGLNYEDVGCGVMSGGYADAFWTGGYPYLPEGHGALQPVSGIYCVDLFDTFGLGQAWYVNRYVIPPPDPQYQPPYALGDMAWSYHAYKSLFMSDAHWATGYQLALWEISNETNGWRDGGVYDPNWATTGSFRVDPTSVDPLALADADAVLQNTILHNGGGTLYHYVPRGAGPGENYGQGLVGDAPEPSGLLLLGAALLGGVGVAWRKRH